jgi:hypothetical protein
VPLLEKLFDSLDVRDNAIIEAEGGHTKFWLEYNQNSIFQAYPFQDSCAHLIFSLKFFSLLKRFGMRIEHMLIEREKIKYEIQNVLHLRLNWY